MGERKEAKGNAGVRKGQADSSDREGREGEGAARVVHMYMKKQSDF